LWDTIILIQVTTKDSNKKEGLNMKINSIINIILLLICVNCVNNHSIDNKKMKYNNNLHIIDVDWKYGFINNNGKIIIEPIYDRVTEFYEGLAEVKIKSRFHAFIDVKENTIIELNYNALVGQFSEGLAGIREEDKRGFIDKNGSFILDLNKSIADDFNKFSEGLVAYEKNNKTGYLDKQGKIIIKPKYDVGWDFKEGLAVVGDKIGAEAYVEGAEDIIFREFLFGYINKQGELIIDMVYDHAYSFSCGYAFVTRSGYSAHFINKQGIKMFENINGYAGGSFRENLAPYFFIDEGKWGYIDVDGNVAIKPLFEAVAEFSDGMAKIKLEKDGPWGYINKQGEIIIEPKYTFCNDFKNGLAEISFMKMYMNSMLGYINKKGELIWPKEGD